MTNGKDFAEKMFSMNEEERLYSTGSEELDTMLEKAFCDGYEYAQKEFAEKKDEKKNHTGAKVAAGVAGTAAVAGAGVYGAKKAGEALVEKGKKTLKEGYTKDGKSYRKGGKFVKADEAISERGNRMIKFGETISKPGKAVSEALGKGKKAVDTAYEQTKEKADKAVKEVKGKATKAKGAVTDAAKTGKKFVEDKAKETGATVAKTWKNMPKAGKAAVIAAPVAAAAVGTGIAIKRKKAKKNNK